MKSMLDHIPRGRIVGQHLMDLIIHGIVQSGNTFEDLVKRVKPTSIDVILGNEIKLEIADRRSMETTLIVSKDVEIDITQVQSQYNTPFNFIQKKSADYTERCIGIQPYALSPKEFILGYLADIIDLPNDITAQFSLTSSLARNGLGHDIATNVWPAWEGHLTLELDNRLQYQYIALKAGMVIGTLTFEKHDPVDDYQGSFQNQRGVVSVADRIEHQ